MSLLQCMNDDSALAGCAAMRENSGQSASAPRYASQVARKDEYINDNLSTRDLFIKLGQKGPDLFDKFGYGDLWGIASVDWGKIWDSLDFGGSPLIDPESPDEEQPKDVQVFAAILALRSGASSHCRDFHWLYEQWQNTSQAGRKDLVGIGLDIMRRFWKTQSLAVIRFKARNSKAVEEPFPWLTKDFRHFAPGWRQVRRRGMWKAKFPGNEADEFADVYRPIAFQDIILMNVRVPLPHWVYADDRLLFLAYDGIIDSAHPVKVLDEALESLSATNPSINSDQAFRAAVLVHIIGELYGDIVRPQPM